MQNMSEPVPQDPIDPGPDGPFDVLEQALACVVFGALMGLALLPLCGEMVAAWLAR